MTRAKRPLRHRLGRPPMAEGQRKVRMHISVSPDVAAAAEANIQGVSKFFEDGARWLMHEWDLPESIKAVFDKGKTD